MKRTPLKRGAPMNRKPMRRKPRSTKYSRRARDFDYMGWIKTQRCLVPMWGFSPQWRGPVGISRCDGSIEAHHAGTRGLGQKAPDSTCLPICSGHHRDRTDHSGPFSGWLTSDLRAFEDTLIAHYQRIYDGRVAVENY